MHSLAERPSPAASARCLNAITIGGWETPSSSTARHASVQLALGAFHVITASVHFSKILRSTSSGARLNIMLQPTQAAIW